MQATTLNTNNTFQSTLSVRRATVPTLEFFAHEIISIHALRKESDDQIYHNHVAYPDFNPRSP